MNSVAVSKIRSDIYYYLENCEAETSVVFLKKFSTMTIVAEGPQWLDPPD